MTDQVSSVMDTEIEEAPPGSEQRVSNNGCLPAPALASDSCDHCSQSTTAQNQPSQSQPQHNLPATCMTSSCPSSWARQTGLKLFSFYSLVKHYVKRFYIVFWHELSMDPRVRLSPWSPPVKDEIKLTWEQVYLTRQRRIFFLVIHCLAVMGLYYSLTGRVSAYTLLWAFFLGFMSSIAVTAGAHRLWSHHSYKAKWPMRLIMAIFQTVAIQYSILNWVRDHRLHHKFVDTDADPHNSRRGFFYSHMGWVLLLPHPDNVEKKKCIDSRDVESDWIVRFQYKYYIPLCVLLCYVIPTIVPWYFWNENLWLSHLVATQLRHVITLHGTFLINSAAHMFGTRPYDKNINPTENAFVSILSFGDGWHNYHHTFPWDYKNAELWDYKLNFSTAFVDLFAWIGLAYDLKTVPADMVAKRVQRTGDGTHPQHDHDHDHDHHHGGVWGWNDKDLTEHDKALTHIINKKEE